jgi:hypothetical protein
MTSPHHTPEAGILTEEIVEKGARAIWREQSGFEPEYEGCKGHWMRQSRDCLTAALPDLIEACAKVVEEVFPLPDKKSLKTHLVANAAGNTIAIAIRSLTHSSKGE